MIKPEIEVLTKAQEILRERGWTRNTMARDADDRTVSIYSDDAVCFCAAGAICRANYEIYGMEGASAFMLARYSRAAFKVTRHEITNYNDLRASTVHDIIDLFEKMKDVQL